VLAAVCTLADVLNITGVGDFCHTTKKIYFLSKNCFIFRKKWAGENLLQITLGKKQMKIYCDSDHKDSTNTPT
jgi:hypothetical protein